MFSQHIFQILSTYWRLRTYCVNICIILFCERFLTNCGILNPSSLIKLYLHITLLSILNKVNCLNLHQLHSSSSRQEKSNPSISIFGGNETTGTGLVWGCCCEKSTRCQNILVPGGGPCYGGVGAALRGWMGRQDFTHRMDVKASRAHCLIITSHYCTTGTPWEAADAQTSSQRLGKHD